MSSPAASVLALLPSRYSSHAHLRLCTFLFRENQEDDTARRPRVVTPTRRFPRHLIPLLSHPHLARSRPTGVWRDHDCRRASGSCWRGFNGFPRHGDKGKYLDSPLEDPWCRDTAVVEHPETVAERIMTYARVVGRDRVMAGADCGSPGRAIPAPAPDHHVGEVRGARAGRAARLRAIVAMIEQDRDNRGARRVWITAASGSSRVPPRRSPSSCPP